MNIAKNKHKKIIITLFLILLFFFSFDSLMSFGEGLIQGIIEGFDTK